MFFRPKTKITSYMTKKKRILDSYFLSQMRRKGIQAEETEVTRYFEDTGWRLYDMDSMMRKFLSWRKANQKVEVEVE